MQLTKTWRGLQSSVRSLARDRLVWFALAGLALFAADRIHQAAKTRIITVDLPLVEKLAVQWHAQTKTPPSPADLDALVQGYIREEILVREAQRLGLVEGDVIIRRRLAQKVEFLLGDIHVPPTPDETTLRAFLKANQAAYATPATISFQHVFTGDKKPDAGLRQKLGRQPENWRQIGQPFMLNRAYANQSESDVAQLMGAAFAAALFDVAQIDAWTGPLRSAYGWHMVRVKRRAAPRPPQFNLLADKLARDWQDNEAYKNRQQAWTELRQQYRVEIAPLEIIPAEANE